MVTLDANGLASKTPYRQGQRVEQDKMTPAEFGLWDVCSRKHFWFSRIYGEPDTCATISRFQSRFLNRSAFVRQISTFRTNPKPHVLQIAAFTPRGFGFPNTACPY